MFWYLTAAAACLVCALAITDIADRETYIMSREWRRGLVVRGGEAGNLLVEVIKPLLMDFVSDRDACCPERTPSKVHIYQAVLQETVEFHVSMHVVANASADNIMSVTINPTEKTGCMYRLECERNSCSYRCKPDNEVSINGSECYFVVATSRKPWAEINLPICIYNRSAEPLKVVNPPAAYFNMGSMTLKYEVGGYPLPAIITVICDEQNGGRKAHRINASISFVQDNVGHYNTQLDNVTAGELRCRVASLSEFHNFTSETDLINVTSPYPMGPTFTLGMVTEQFTSHAVTAVIAKADASILLHSEPTASGQPKEVIMGLSTAAVASTVIIVIVVGVTMWRRNATRRQVTLIANENHHTTIVNNDNRQTIVNNCQHNYVDMLSPSGVFDIKDMLLAWDNASPTSYIDHSIHGQCQRPPEESVCINDDHSDGVL